MTTHTVYQTGSDIIKQLDLFGNNKKLPVKRHKRRYSIKHWSYKQRVIHYVHEHKIPYKQVLDILKYHRKPAVVYRPVIKYIAVPRSNKKIDRPIKLGHVFHRTVNRKQLAKAVHAMYMRRHRHYPLSINKICKKFKVSKPSLYRGYHHKYKK